MSDGYYPNDLGFGGYNSKWVEKIKPSVNCQKCWACKWSTGLPTTATGRKCPWVSGRPVPGWEAKLVVHREKHGADGLTYQLRYDDYCPLFEQDDGNYKVYRMDRSAWDQ